MTIDEIQKQIVEEFSSLKDLAEKYQYLINLAKKMEPLDPKFKTESNLIKGCQSSLWINIEIIAGKMIIKGETDVMITKGILNLILRVYNNQTISDVANTELFFIEKIGLKRSLSPQRATGVRSMIEHIKKKANSEL